MASNEKCYCGSGRKRRYCCDKPQRKLVRVNAATDEKRVAVVTRNLLTNLVRRDINPICTSFDQHYGARLRPIDGLFSDTAFLLFTTTRCDGNIREDYESVLYGLLSNAQNGLGSATVLLRSGFYKQALLLIRQAIEIASTVIHIIGDDTGKALRDFKEDKYSSTKSLSKAKAAIPVIGELWGFLSNSYVHITSMYGFAQALRPYKEDQYAVIEVIDCLRMAAWIVYLATEIAFPMSLAENRYWKPLTVGSRNAVAFNPSQEEREWAANYLNKEGLTANDIAPARDGAELDTSGDETDLNIVASPSPGSSVAGHHI
jgi:hypothetical protein